MWTWRTGGKLLQPAGPTRNPFCSTTASRYVNNMSYTNRNFLNNRALLQEALNLTPYVFSRRTPGLLIAGVALQHQGCCSSEPRQFAV